MSLFRTPCLSFPLVALCTSQTAHPESSKALNAESLLEVVTRGPERQQFHCRLATTPSSETVGSFGTP